MPRGSIPMCLRDTFPLGRIKFHVPLPAAGLLTSCEGASLMQSIFRYMFFFSAALRRGLFNGILCPYSGQEAARRTSMPYGPGTPGLSCESRTGVLRIRVLRILDPVSGLCRQDIRLRGESAGQSVQERHRYAVSPDLTDRRVDRKYSRQFIISA